jgi:LuxR family maltose regulon positive regulatory protein
MPVTLIRSKFQHPVLPGDLIPRRRLLDRLHAGASRKLTLISAQAGAGKTTLLAQWLEEDPRPSAWLSLDEDDNDPIVFLTYLCAAIRSAFPGACDEALSLLGATTLPPAGVFVASIVNELAQLVAGSVPTGDGPVASLNNGGSSGNGLILALDDYHTITEPGIQEMMTGLIKNLPHGAHVALATRVDPRLPLARLRARRKMTEVRSIDLRFTLEEAETVLTRTSGRDLDPETIRILEDKTEGWVVGLRLAALSLRILPDAEAFAQQFRGTSSALIVEYLLDEVLARQSSELQDFALRTSLLDRFCAPLCEAVTGVPAARSQEIIDSVARDNLFLVPLDQEGRWYRYHHLFRDLLRERLKPQLGTDEIATLHTCASEWLEQSGLTEEALEHALAAGDTERAAMLVEAHRHKAMNGERWRLLRRWLDLLPREVIERRAQLLLVEAWLAAVRFKLAELFPIVERIKIRIEASEPSVNEADQAVLDGEIAALMSFVYFWLGQGQAGLDNGRQALEVTPPEHRWVRGTAITYRLGAYHLVGQPDRIYDEAPKALAQDWQYGGAHKHRIILSLMYSQFLAGNLRLAEQSAIQLQDLTQPHRLYVTCGLAIEARALIYYLWNDLDRARQYYAHAAELRYRANAETVLQGLFGLALTRQALGEPDQASQMSEAAFAWAREIGDGQMLIKAHALASRLALLQGEVPDTSHWSVPLGDTFSLMLLPEIPHLTLARALIARATPSALRQAADLLARLRSFAEATHDTWHLIEIQSLQALLQAALGQQEKALALLEGAIQSAQPGGFIRLFVDLGPGLVPLLCQLHRQGVAPGYLDRVLAAFPDGQAGNRAGRGGVSEPQPLVEPLTPRELEVLALLGRHLINKEIAAELVISPVTVKTHTLNIYRKLDVHNRREAVERARELNLL